MPAIIGDSCLDYIELEATPKQADELRTDAYVFAGVRFSTKKLEDLVKGAARHMKNSSTYQHILNEGKADATRDLLIRFAQKRLGVPSSATQAKLDSIMDASALTALIDRLDSVEAWDDLLATSQVQTELPVVNNTYR